jgi:Phage tail tube protein, GTA-gp10
MTHPSNNVSITINGAEEKLRLTLGALADIEDAFGGDMDAIKERLTHPRVSDILFVLHALLLGGGSVLTREALRASDIDIADAARAIAATFEALGARAAPGKPPMGERPQDFGGEA